MLGKMSDVDVAKVTGWSAPTVHARRNRLGIPAYNRVAQRDVLGENTLYDEATDIEPELFVRFGQVPE